MTKENFIQYLKTYEVLDSNTLSELNNIVDKYPYFQIAQIAYTLNLLKLNHKNFTKQLTLASAQLSNRKLLKLKTEELFAKETNKSEITKEKAKKATIIKPVTEPVISEIINEEKSAKTEEIQTIDLKEESDTLQASEIIIDVENEVELKSDATNQIVDSSVNTISSENEKINQEITEKPIKETEIQTNKEEIIDKFIKEKPKINPLQTNKDYTFEIDKHSLTENDDFVSETLALVYEKQGYFTKAIKIYQKLILEFPEKSSFFASRIEKLKNTSNQ